VKLQFIFNQCPETLEGTEKLQILYRSVSGFEWRIQP